MAFRNSAVKAGATGRPAAVEARRRPRSVLLLADDFAGHANTILDQLRAFREVSGHHVSLFNPRGLPGNRFLDPEDFDVVVIHYSLVITSDHYLAPEFREKIRAFRGLKIQLIQDDYRWVDDITAMMRHLGIDVLYTLVPQAEVPKIWEARLPGVQKITYLAGYVSDKLLSRAVPPFEVRPLEIGYRGRVLPYWLGRIGQEKAWIAQGVRARAEQYGLLHDVGWREEDRIYGRSWVDFISSCKATLGSESGATITDFDGSVERSVKEFLAKRPDADFEEVHRAVLAHHEGNVRMNVISPRIFEAAALRTGLILFPGEYSGVLRPYDHYLPLAKDFSNMGEIVGALRTPELMKEMITRTYEEIALAERYSVRAFIREFDELVWRESETRRRGAASAQATSRSATALGHLRRRARVTLARLSGRTAKWARSRSAGVMRHVPARFPLPTILIRAPLRLFQGAAFILAGRLEGRVLRVVRDPDLPKGAVTIDLARDLIRLGLLRGALAGRRGPGQRYRIRLEVDDGEGRLTFHSLPLRAASPSEKGDSIGDAGAAEKALLAARKGELRLVAWDHSLVDRDLTYPFPVRNLGRIGMNSDGIWRFRALEALMARHPEFVAAALETVLREHRPAGSAPEDVPNARRDEAQEEAGRLRR